MNIYDAASLLIKWINSCENLDQVMLCHQMLLNVFPQTFKATPAAVYNEVVDGLYEVVSAKQKTFAHPYTNSNEKIST